MTSDSLICSLASKTALHGTDPVVRLAEKNTVQNELRGANANVRAQAEPRGLLVVTGEGEGFQIGISDSIGNDRGSGIGTAVLAHHRHVLELEFLFVLRIVHGDVEHQ